MRVYFVGASGVGKSTLARHAAERFGLKLLPSAARQVSAELGLASAGDVFGSTDAADAFQSEVFRRQLKNESEAGDRFVSDRAFDHVAYAAEVSLTTWQTARSEEWRGYLDSLRLSSAVVFFVRPAPGGAWPSARDGTRDRYLEPAMVHRVDGVVQYVLESNEVPYIPVLPATPRDRTRLVEWVLWRLTKG